MTLIGAAMMGSLDDFKKFCEPGMATSWSERDGSTLLTTALGNTDHRAEICNFLLDEGADASVSVRPDGYNCLHILLSYVLDKVHPENNESDLALMQRLLDGGADINALDRRDGTPLQHFISKLINLRNENVAIPFYDVLFSRPELDLEKIGAFKQSTYESIWKSYRGKILLQYAQHHMRGQGVAIPDFPPLPPLLVPRVVSTKDV